MLINGYKNVGFKMVTAGESHPIDGRGEEGNVKA
jgi:hypothetical protein